MPEKPTHPLPGKAPVLEPGHTFGTITDKIS